MVFEGGVTLRYVTIKPHVNLLQIRRPSVVAHLFTILMSICIDTGHTTKDDGKTVTN